MRFNRKITSFFIELPCAASTGKRCSLPASAGLKKSRERLEQLLLAGLSSLAGCSAKPQLRAWLWRARVGPSAHLAKTGLRRPWWAEQGVAEEDAEGEDVVLRNNRSACRPHRLLRLR